VDFLLQLRLPPTALSSTDASVCIVVRIFAASLVSAYLVYLGSPSCCALIRVECKATGRPYFIATATGWTISTSL
jgi:hypothetical protein